ncbi:hypothetical protein TRVA0_002S05248 [Trichomonascus vanleenenianus]|uniref:uncharacterized protein n=1 Tax=Trichomonascus vanleenenianus TaxID=2268995 RepID=UPI003ECB57EB
MEFHLLKIAESAESIRSQHFKRPGVFGNTISSPPEITSLIRDADAPEYALFTTRKTRQKVSEKSLPTTSDNVDLICEAVEQLNALYPINGVSERVGFLRSKWQSLNESIFNYENIVEEQRQKLAELHMCIENRDYYRSSSGGSGNLFSDASLDDPAKVEDLIFQAEQDIANLSKELEEKQNEVNRIEGNLMR